MSTNVVLSLEGLLQGLGGLVVAVGFLSLMVLLLWWLARTETKIEQEAELARQKHQNKQAAKNRELQESSLK